MENENKSILDYVSEDTLTAKGVKQKDIEYDLVASLLKAAEYKTSDDTVTTVKIGRGGVHYFDVHIHPVSDSDIKAARKKAEMKSRNSQKRNGQSRKELDTARFNNLLIYFATTEDDKKKIWGNEAIKEKYDIMEPWESIDALLTAGEKNRLLDEVMKISGFDDEDAEDDEDLEDYAKNS